MEKRVYIETYGCQMNEDDSERMLRLLEECSYIETSEPREADLILINTCSVREKPEQKVYSALGRFRRVKEERGSLLAVAGCVAQQEGKALLDRVPYLDLVIGTQALSKLPGLLERVRSFGERVCETSFDGEEKPLRLLPPRKRGGQVKAFVTIMQGCDHFCSFCIVPYVRGRERSRPSSKILEEIRHLARSGVVEVCLLGQNVNSYGKGIEGELDFPELLRRIEEIEGIQRIRFTTSHPEDLSEGLIEAFSELSKLCEHIHLPFQSGSNRILRRMHRRYTREFYLDRIDRLRRACPSIAITADVIVGFPGEEARDFEETLDLIQTVRFDDLFSFKYSPRKGTRASSLPDPVDERTKQERLALLQGLQREITLEKNRALEGSVQEVLVEGRSKQSEREVTGRIRSNRIVNFEGSLDWVGRLVPVRITQAYPHSLRAELTDH